jgi:hypothetical protein
MVGPQSWSGRFGEEKILLPLVVFEPQTLDSVTVTILQLRVLAMKRMDSGGVIKLNS